MSKTQKKVEKKMPKKELAKKKSKALAKTEKKVIFKSNTDDNVTASLSIVPHTGKEQGHRLRGIVINSKEIIDTAKWNLAEALFTIQDTSAYLNWGYPHWETYVESEEVGMNKRTAHYLITVYKYFTQVLVKDELSLDEADPIRIEALKKRDAIVEQVKHIGWTKAKALIGVIDDVNTADKWIEKAKSLTERELNHEKKIKLGGKQDDDSDKEAVEKEKTSNVTFALFEEQREVVENSLELAERISGSTKRGNLIHLIALDYLSTNMAQNTSAGMGSYLDKIGAIFGVYLIAVDKETGTATHNAQHLDKIKD